VEKICFFCTKLVADQLAFGSAFHEMPRKLRGFLGLLTVY